MAITQLNQFTFWSRRTWNRVLPLLLGVLASLGIVLLWQQLVIRENVYIEQLIQQQATAIESTLSKELSLRMRTLRQMANRWQVNGGTAQKVWEADAQAYIADFYGYQALEWVNPSFQVRWIVPERGNEAALNLELNREPRRQLTLQIARDLRQIILTRKISLVQGGKGFLAVAPLFVGDRFDGFIIGVFQFQLLFDSILKAPEGYQVVVYDGQEAIYSQGLPGLRSRQKTVIVNAYNADWRVEVAPTPAFIAKVHSSLPIVVLSEGLILVWLSVLVIYLAQISYDQQHRVQKANRQLEWEIHQREQAEAAMMRLAAIVESSEDAIISTNLDNVITSWNLGAERNFGYRASEMVGQSGRKLIPANYQDEDSEVLRRIRQGERIDHYESQWYRQDGNLIDLSLSVSPIKDEFGTIVGAAKIARNIVERKQTEEALRQSEARYRQLIDNLHAGFVIHGPDSSILLCNPMACALLGLSMEQMLGRTALDSVWYFLREDGTVMPIEEYPANLVLATGMPLKNYVLGIHTTTRPLIWVLVNAYPEFEANGQFQQVVVTFINISDRKQAEETIKKTRNFLQALLDHLPVAVFVKDARPEQFGIFQFWNKTSEQLFGISAEQAIGKTCYDFFPIEQATWFDRKDREVFLKGVTEDIAEETIDSYSRGKCWLHTVKIPLYDEQNQPQYLLCFSEDITHQKQAQVELQEMSQVMENAVSGISRIDSQGNYVYVNKTYANITGYQPEEMIGMSWQGTVHPDELEKLLAIYHQMVEEGRVEVETTGVRKDGSIFYKQLVMISSYDEQHQFVGHYCFMKDISDRKQAEIDLRVSQERFAGILEIASDAIISININHEITLFNKGAEQIFGYTSEEVLGKPLGLLIPHRFAEGHRQHINQYRYGGGNARQMAERGAIFGRRKDGTEFPAEASISKLNLNGEIIFTTFLRDISDRQRMENALRESEARFQAFMNYSPAPAWIVDGNGIVLYLSETYFRTFQVPDNYVVGQPLSELFPPAIVQPMWDNIQTAIQTQQVLEAIESAPRADGSLGDFLVYKFPIPDSSGQILVGGVAIDITRQHQIEVALQVSEERLKLALEASGDGLWDWNLETGDVYLSPPYLEMLGYQPGELVMDLEVWEQMIHPDDRARASELLKAHLQDPSVKYAFDYRIRCKSGEWKWIADYGEVVAYNRQGKPSRMIGTHKDISDRKSKELALQQAMEAAEAANLAKSIFLANMSHELRTPLNVILGFAQVMAHDPSLTPNQQEDLQTIRRSGDHLLSLINDVLDLSKIESGHCTVEESSFDLIALLHSLRNMFAERASSKGLELCFEIGPEVPQFVVADAQKLRQVLLNLLSNAIKFTHRGSITLQVTSKATMTDRASQTSHLVQFDVTDTGVGIAPEEMSSIFDAFVQAQAGKRSTSGTGLGLTISRKLLQLMGGEITVTSTLGQGSRFTFTLPVTPVSDINLSSPQDDRLVIGLAPGQPHHRILVVDDRSENRLLVVRLLTQLGLEVREASNGREAVQIWQEWQPDLTWMDIRMPGLNGYEATKQIRALEQGRNSIIIALTAQASESDRTLALEAGCNDYISKPFREQTLFLKMGQYLGLEYCYAESDLPSDLQTHPSVSLADETLESLYLDLLPTLPAGWLATLEDAAICGNDRAIVALAAQFPQELSQLATHLNDLAEKYEFERILQLLQANSSS